MRKLLFGVLAAIFVVVTACGQGQINTPQNAMIEFNKFQVKEKFQQDDSLFYPGIEDPSKRPIFTEIINLAALDFKRLASKGSATDKEYQTAIELGLKRFDPYVLELDTEDRARVASYFEEMMDIVGLESSNGHLNNFVYGFDPTGN